MPIREGYAEGADGNMLLKTCSAKDTTNQGICIGFLLGVKDAFWVWEQLDENVSIDCTSEGVTGDQRTDIFVKYLKDHPAKRHEPAVILYLYALKEAFPCPE